MRRLLSMLVCVSALSAQDALEIVRRSVQHDQANWERAKNYTYVVRSTMRERDSGGKVKKTEAEAEEIYILYGEPYEKRIEKDGKPLPAEEQRKEQQKFDKEMARRQNESPEQRRKRIEAFEKKRREQRDFAREIPEAYNFKLVGEENVNGRPAWVVDATPRAEYQPRNSRAAMLKKFRGRMWIDQKEYQWVRMDGEVIDTVSWGVVLARLAKGSRIFFEQVRVNDEVWMPKQVKVNLDARIALLKRYQGDIDLSFQDFRKFQSESRIVSTAELNKTP
ncbi:MAG: hypothetical protein JNL62_11345 [Bryobacterales bacterium]|nr:hypothetical protein [Bryobacterales bacterium]